MNIENIVEKWANCGYSLNFGSFAGDESGYALKEEGYNENYGCEHPEIVESGLYPIKALWERGGITEVAVLHGIGKFDDPKVLTALTTSCSTCLFYLPRK